MFWWYWDVFLQLAPEHFSIFSGAGALQLGSKNFSRKSEWGSVKDFPGRGSHFPRSGACIPGTLVCSQWVDGRRCEVFLYLCPGYPSMFIMDRWGAVWGASLPFSVVRGPFVLVAIFPEPPVPLTSTIVHLLQYGRSLTFSKYTRQKLVYICFDRDLCEGYLYTASYCLVTL